MNTTIGPPEAIPVERPPDAIAEVAPEFRPAEGEDYRAALWLLDEKLLKECRYARLGLRQDDIEALATDGASEPLPTSVEGRIHTIEQRLRRALDNMSASAPLAGPATRPIAAGTAEVTKLPPRKDRKELQYDYKKRDRFSLRRFELERRCGSESDEARLDREDREAAIERAAGKIRLAPILENTPTVCQGCGEPIPGDAKRFVVLCAELPHVGLEVAEIARLAVVCARCRQADAVPSRARESQVDESWLADLSADEFSAWRSHEQGLNQTQVGATMGKSQATISRLLKRAEGKRAEYRRKKLHSTGGA